MGNLKRRLVAYPVLYEIIIKLIRGGRRLISNTLQIIKKFISSPNQHNLSRKYISKEQGLLRITVKDSKEIVEPIQPYLAHYESDQ